MNNVLLSAEHIKKAMADPKFFEQMPEFSSIKAKVATITGARTSVGCSSCRERRIRSNMHGDFVNILNTLSDSAMLRFKKYLGAETLLVNAFDRNTGKTVLKRF